jgi:uncharacterized phage protein gp47/JayE
MQTKSGADIDSGFATAVQASSSGLVDFGVGSILLAVGEATKQVVLWLQGLILSVLTLSRAATCKGADLDSWMADFGFTRLPAAKATGSVTFSRLTTTAQGLVPTASTVQTADGSQVFVVTTDTGNSAWNGGLGGYTLAIGVATVTVPVRAAVAGAAGNVRKTLINTIASAITGIDAVNNTTRATGGADPETDTAFRARFQTSISGLGGGTLASVDMAVANTSGVKSHKTVENKNADDTTNVGHFYVVIDDGTGSPANSLVTAVTASLNAVVPITTTFEVAKSTILTANITFKIAAAAGYTVNAMQNKAGAAVTAYMNTLGLGQGINLTKIAQIAYEASPGITNVFNIQINGSAADLAGNAKKVARGTVTVTH